MSKRIPEIHLPRLQRSVLQLLIQLLLEHENDSYFKHNQPEQTITLKESELSRLVETLGELLNDKEFNEIATFFDKLYTRGNVAKKVFSTYRKKRGRHSAMISTHWHDLRTRIGLIKDGSYPYFNKKKGVQPLTFQQFITKEKQIFETLKIPSSITPALMQIVEEQSSRLPIKNPDHLYGVFKEIFHTLYRDAQKKIAFIPQKKLYHAVLALSNTATLFTTRDWTAAGVLSVMAASASSSLSS